MNWDCVCVVLVFVNYLCHIIALHRYILHLHMSMHFDIFSCNFVKLKYIKKMQGSGMKGFS